MDSQASCAVWPAKSSKGDMIASNATNRFLKMNSQLSMAWDLYVYLVQQVIDYPPKQVLSTHNHP